MGMISTFRVALMLSLAATLPAAAQTTITFASYGGAYQAAQRKALLDPIEKMLNITIKEDTLTGIADVRAQVGAKAVKWDVADLGGVSCARGAAEGLFEPLDYSVIKTDGIDKAMAAKDWIGVIYYSTVIAWNTQKFGMNGPQSWADFWDVQKFPGPRSMRNDPSDNLEFALLADGVPIDKLYPLDVDRAFRKMDQIKKHVAVWWTTGGQSAHSV